MSHLVAGAGAKSGHMTAAAIRVTFRVLRAAEIQQHLEPALSRSKYRQKREEGSKVDQTPRTMGYNN